VMFPRKLPPIDTHDERLTQSTVVTCEETA
jgi:hypothetical protein